MKTSLDIIRAACIKANPEKEHCFFCKKRGYAVDCPSPDPLTLRLADVLLAMQGKENIIGISYNGDFLDCSPKMDNLWKKVGFPWNLRFDDLTLQTQETQDFIAGILQ